MQMRNTIATVASLLILAATTATAQNQPIQINTVVPPPYPQTYEEAISVGENSTIIVQNTDQSTTYEVKLSVEVEGDNGISFRTLPQATPVAPLVLAPGETRNLSSQELESLYANYNENDIQYEGFNAQEMAQNPYLPEGNYTICITALDYNTSAQLSSPQMSGCSPPIYITPISPPIITNPQSDSEVMQQTPQLLNINWTPVTYNSPMMRYEFQMVDITDLDINPYDALNSNNFQFYQQENLQTNTLVYDASKPQLTTGHTYAMRVRAYLLDGSLNIQNQGWSDIVTFTYTENTLADDDTGDDDTGSEDEDDTGVTTTGGSDTTPLPEGEFDCNSSCSVNVQSLSEQPAENLTEGATVQMGNFTMNMNSFTGNASSGYSGTGYVEITSFFPAPVRVEFSGIKVNENNRVISGSAEAVTRDGSWLNDSWENLQSNFSFGSLGKTPAQVFQNIQSEQYILEQLDQVQTQAGISMPVGYGDGNYKVQILSIKFNPDNARFNSFVMVPIPDDRRGEQYLAFGANDLCLTPGGPALGGDPARLALVREASFEPSEKVGFTFHPNDGGEEGSFVELDCNGFYRARINGLARFSPEVFIAENSQGEVAEEDTVVASFSAHFGGWDNWMGQVDFNTLPPGADPSSKQASGRFQHKKLNGYSFMVNNAVVDHSDTLNAEMMTFPSHYSGGADSTWQGVYLRQFNVRFPKWMGGRDSEEDRVMLEVENLLVDASGVSTRVSGNNLVEEGEGGIDGWDFTMNSFEVEFLQNQLHAGEFSGGLHVPVTDSLMDYTAQLSFSDSLTQTNFSVSTNEEIQMPGFLAAVTLAPNSTIEVDVQSDSDVMVEASLHGSMDLPEQIGQIPGCNLEGITFQDLTVRSQAEPKYLEVGSFGTNGSLNTPQIGGFSVSLEGLDFQEVSGNDYALNFGLGINLGTDAVQVSGQAGFKLNSRFKPQLTGNKFEFQDTQLDAFQVSGDLPGVSVEATVQFYDNEQFGHGFHGTFEAEFMESARVEATAMFGVKPTEDQDIRYWLVDGIAAIKPGITFAPPMAFHGFGGGVYYNIAPQSNPGFEEVKQANESQGQGSNGSSGIDAPDFQNRYQVSDGALGLSASVIVGMQAEQVFNADATLTVTINTNTWGLENIQFIGNGVMMASIDERDQTPVEVDVNMNYDRPNKTFDTELELDVEVPRGNNPVLTGGGTMAFHISPELWYLKFGWPSEDGEHYISGTVDYGISSTSLDTYFMTGEELPAPILPDEIAQEFDFTPTVMSNALQSGSGIAFGAHMDMSVADIDILVAALSINVKAGFDITAMDYSNCLCNGNSDFGIKQWYTNGMGYILGDLGISVANQTLLQITTGMIVEGGFPNPTGLDGRVKVDIETMLKDINISQPFSVGTICKMEPVSTPDGEPVKVPSPVEDMDLVDHLVPSNTQNNASLSMEPGVVFATNPYDELEFTYPDGQGGIYEEKVRFALDIDWERFAGDNWVNVSGYETEWDESSLTYSMMLMDEEADIPALLWPNTQYRIQSTMTAEVLNENGNWEVMEYTTGENEGDPVEDYRVQTFTTEGAPDIIDPAHIDFSRPYDRQRYVLQNDYSDAWMKFNTSYVNVFNEMEDAGYDFQAHFMPLEGEGQQHYLDIDYDNALRTSFSLPDLDNETIYKVVFTGTGPPLPDEGESESSGDDENTDDSSGNGNNLSSLNVDFPVYSAFDPTSGGSNVISGGSGNGSNTTVNVPGSYNIGDSGTSDNSISDNSSNSTLVGEGGETTISGIDIEDEEQEVIKQMYTWYFRTSKYNTMLQKLNTFSISSVDVEVMPAPQAGEHSLTSFSDYYRIQIDFNGGEPFDEFDVFGHPYLDVPFSWQGMSIFMNNPRAGESDWGRDVYSNIYDTGGSGPGQDPGTLQGEASQTAQYIDDIYGSLPSIQEFTHITEFGAGAVGLSSDYACIAQPLSDSELNIGTESGGSDGGGSDDSDGGGLYIGPFMTFDNATSTSGPELSVYFKGDLMAKDAWETLENNLPIGMDYDYDYPAMISEQYEFGLRVIENTGSNQQEAGKVVLSPVMVTIPD